jgi:hypothetical protein
MYQVSLDVIDTPDLLEGGGSHENFLRYPETVKAPPITSPIGSSPVTFMWWLTRFN